MLISQAEAARITQLLDLKTELPSHTDLAFVFGTHLSAPAHIAADLVIRGIVERVVLTGGRNRLTGDNEAAAHLEILLKSGVHRDRIIVERDSTDTRENVVFALREIARHVDIQTITSILVVAKWYHCRRAMMTLKRHLPEGVRYFAVTYEPEGLTRSDWWLTEEGRQRVMKEQKEIPEYLRWGYVADIKEDCGAFI